MTCAANPASCQQASANTGNCEIADPGFYVEHDYNISACSSIDPNCTQCRNGDGKCTTCATNYAFSEALNKCIFNCPNNNHATNVANNGCYFCSILDPMCNKCKDLEQTCTECAPNFTLGPPGTNLCRPTCPADQYYNQALNICQGCPVNCLRCQDGTGQCIQCINS